jgi:hypothetical protein
MICIVLNVIMLNVIMLNVIMLNVIMLNVIMLNVIMPIINVSVMVLCFTRVSLDIISKSIK